LLLEALTKEEAPGGEGKNPDKTSKDLTFHCGFITFDHSKILE